MHAVLGVQGGADWLIDNAETYDRLLEALNGARRSIRIAQLAFDFDCVAYASGDAFDALPRDVVIAETLIARATTSGPEIQILLNASWLLNTARPLRKAFAKRGISSERIQVRGFNRFPHFMHAKLVLVDSHEAFLLGSPFVNSYWDDARHAPFDARRPLRELLDAITRARTFIYVEHQYLTSRPIVAALAAALRREAALEIIIVLNQNPDLTAYRGWQNERLAEHGLLVHPRVGVFALWSVDEHPEHAGVARINQLFIHSKVIVIDDTWAGRGARERPHARSWQQWRWRDASTTNDRSPPAVQRARGTAGAALGSGHLRAPTRARALLQPRVDRGARGRALDTEHLLTGGSRTLAQ